jgi:hypothetical protein
LGLAILLQKYTAQDKQNDWAEGDTLIVQS